MISSRETRFCYSKEIEGTFREKTGESVGLRVPAFKGRVKEYGSGRWGLSKGLGMLSIIIVMTAR